MEKCEARKLILKYQRNIKCLREIKVDTEELKQRQVNDIEILKKKIEKLEKELKQ